MVVHRHNFPLAAIATVLISFGVAFTVHKYISTHQFDPWDILYAFPLFVLGAIFWVNIVIDELEERKIAREAQLDRVKRNWDDLR